MFSNGGKQLLSSVMFCKCWMDFNESTYCYLPQHLLQTVLPMGKNGVSSHKNTGCVKMLLVYGIEQSPATVSLCMHNIVIQWYPKSMTRNAHVLGLISDRFQWWHWALGCVKLCWRKKGPSAPALSHAIPKHLRRAYFHIGGCVLQASLSTSFWKCNHHPSQGCRFNCKSKSSTLRSGRPNTASQSSLQYTFGCCIQMRPPTHSVICGKFLIYATLNTFPFLLLWSLVSKIVGLN